jgi:hypothetical protein
MSDTPVNIEKQPVYHSYLLRLWLENEQSRSWRMSLENAHTGERMGFACLDALFDFLYQQIEIPPQMNTGLEQGKEVNS